MSRSGMFRCNRCGRAFDTYEDLDSHQKHQCFAHDIKRPDIPQYPSLMQSGYQHAGMISTKPWNGVYPPGFQSSPQTMVPSVQQQGRPGILSENEIRTQKEKESRQRTNLKRREARHRKDRRDKQEQEQATQNFKKQLEEEEKS